MLSWPTEWSALHGIAEIVTPVLRVSTNTDLTGDKVVVQRQGTTYPAEGASGLRFPFQRRDVVRLTSGRSFRAGVAHAAGGCPQDNGFSSAAAMEEAHRTVLAAAAGAQLAGVALDLGAGDGRLLEQLRAAHPGLTSVLAVESDSERAAAARRRLGDRAVWEGDLFGFAWSGPVDLVVCMPGRLLEVDGERAGALGDRILEAPARLLYAYGDWLTKEPGGLAGLIRRTGLGTGQEIITRGDGVEATLIVA